MGFKNSSITISPGWGFGRRSVVIDDFGFVGIAFFPREANPPLIVDADRILAPAVTLEGFEPVGRRGAQVLEATCIVEQTQFPQRYGLKIGGQSPAPPARPNGRRLGIAKTDDHCTCNNAERYALQAPWSARWRKLFPTDHFPCYGVAISHHRRVRSRRAAGPMSCRTRGGLFCANTSFRSASRSISRPVLTAAPPRRPRAPTRSCGCCRPRETTGSTGS